MNDGLFCMDFMEKILLADIHGQFKLCSTLQEKQSRVIVDSDEEIEGGFSCLIDVKETGTP